MSFASKKLECVLYLGNMLNDTGRVEQAVAARVRAAWMKFSELGGILCTRGTSLRTKGVVYKVFVKHADVWGRNLGDEPQRGKC